MGKHKHPVHGRNVSPRGGMAHSRPRRGAAIESIWNAYMHGMSETAVMSERLDLRRADLSKLGSKPYSYSKLQFNFMFELEHNCVAPTSCVVGMLDE